jgi:hypothetical protein
MKKNNIDEQFFFLKSSIYNNTSSEKLESSKIDRVL